MRALPIVSLILAVVALAISAFIFFGGGLTDAGTALVGGRATSTATTSIGTTPTKTSTGTAQSISFSQKDAAPFSISFKTTSGEEAFSYKIVPLTAATAAFGETFAGLKVTEIRVSDVGRTILNEAAAGLTTPASSDFAAKAVYISTLTGRMNAKLDVAGFQAALVEGMKKSIVTAKIVSSLDLSYPTYPLITDEGTKVTGPTGQTEGGTVPFILEAYNEGGGHGGSGQQET